MLEPEILHAMCVTPAMVQRPAGSSAPVAKLSRKAWFVVIVYSLSVIVFGAALGYMLSGRPDLSSIRSKMTGVTHGSVHLRVDYQLRDGSLCVVRSLHCRRIRVGSR
jgi:hypothetical protein